MSSVTAPKRRSFSDYRASLGRFRPLMSLISRAWPLLRPLATVYRRLVLRRVKVIAVTGTHGKTTTTRAIKVLLGEAVDRFPRRSAGSFLAIELLRISPRRRYAVLELGISRSGQMREMARMVKPDITVVTSIGREHITSMKSLKITRQEKAELVEVLNEDGLAVLNRDDPNVMWMAQRTKARLTTFGTDPSADVQATKISLEWPHGTRFTVRTADASADVSTRLLGRHWAPVVLAAVAVGLELGLKVEESALHLEHLEPSAQRIEKVRLACGAWLIRDEELSSMESIDAALDLLAEIPAERKILVLGEMTEPPTPGAPAFRRIGQRVAEVVTRAIFMGSRKTCSQYGSGARRGGMKEESVSRARRNIDLALARLPSDLGPADVILVKGSRRERLERLSLRLMGTDVQCRLETCSLPVACEHCPYLLAGAPRRLHPRRDQAPT